MNSEPSNQRCMSVLESIENEETVRLSHARQVPSGSCASTWVASYGKLKKMLAHLLHLNICSKKSCKMRRQHTRHDITCVHSIFVLNKAKAVHKLDLGDLASAMGVEVVLNIGLGSYSYAVQSANSVELSEGPRAQAPAPTAVDQCQGDSVHASQCRVARQVRVRQERGADAVQKWRKGSEKQGQPRPHPRFLGMQCPVVRACVGARAGNGREVCMEAIFGRAQRSVPLRGRLPR